MCATCWDRPFCMNSDGTTFAREGSTCPAGSIASEQANRIVGLSRSTETFHCIRPAGKDILGTGTACPGDDAGRARIAEVQKCLDVPRACRTDLEKFGDCAEVRRPEDPGCVDTRLKTGSAFRTACGDTAGGHEAGRVAASEKLNKLCELHGASVPTAAAGRFCWTSCLDIKTECKSDSFIFDLPEGCSQACDASIFDPPEVSQYSTVLKFNKPSGTTLTVRADEDHVQQQFTTVFGAMTIEIPAACRGPLGKGKLASCPINIGMIKLAAHNNVSFFGKAVSNIRLLNPEPIRGTISTIEDVSLFSVPAGTQLYVSADLEGKGRVGNVFTAADGLLGAIKWATREYVFIGNLTAPDGSSSALVTLTATLPNVPPVARPGADQTIECSSPKGTLVTLNGTASTDADGPSDIRRHAWTSALLGVLEGASVQAKVPLGQTPFELNVEDRTGAVDTKVTRVNVVDTTSPTFKEIDARTDCLWPADNKMRLLRLGIEIGVCTSDTCDSNVKVKIIGG